MANRAGRLTRLQALRRLAVPCIERCAFGAVKAWIVVMMATNEIASRRRVDLDTIIDPLTDTREDMNSRCKEAGEAGPAQNLLPCRAEP